MRILIVEDDPSLASGLARILEAEGYAVDVAGRGEEAVGAARGERFDLVILDIGLLGKVEKIVSKESIIQAVAGWDEDLSPNAIEVYISRLRTKLERAGVHIRTVRGFGYMLEEFKIR